MSQMMAEATRCPTHANRGLTTSAFSFPVRRMSRALVVDGAEAVREITHPLATFGELTAILR
jgi:hypothetical protein